MIIGVLLRTGPYTAQSVDSIYEIGKRALGKGHKLKIFLYEDGVLNVDKDITSPQERNIRERLRELVEMGAEMKACGTCAKFRGQKKEDLMEGVKYAGMAYLVEIVKEADIFLSFGF